MSLVSENVNDWPPQAGGSSPLLGGRFCQDTKAGVLKRACAFGSSIGLFYECDGKPLQSFVLARDEELARRVVEMFMQRQGWTLGDLGNLKM
jgi:hypothetical protein